MRVVIDHDLCTGHGRCYVLAPTLFVDDDAGYGQVIGDGSVSEAQLEEARRGVAGCPEHAVSIVDGED